ncbi:MAG: hypothetical protein KF819_10650 [Labilithrix sp.]|nr:hypothetical protein [Labilithrix sp.]
MRKSNTAIALFGAAALFFSGCAAELDPEDTRSDTASIEGVPGFTNRAYSIDVSAKRLPSCLTAGCDLRLRLVARNVLNATQFEACVVFPNADDPAYRELRLDRPQPVATLRYGGTYGYTVQPDLSVPVLGNLRSVEFIVEEGDFERVPSNALWDRAGRDAFGNTVVATFSPRACEGPARARRGAHWAWFDQNRDAVQADRGTLWNAVVSEFRSTAVFDGTSMTVSFAKP